MAQNKTPTQAQLEAQWTAVPENVPPLPPGYKLDQPAQAGGNIPPLPPGYTLDNPSQAQLEAQWTPVAEPPQQGWLSRAGSVASDLGAGFVKGAGQTVNSVSKVLNAVPGVGEYLAPSAGIRAAQQIETPRNTAQQIGSIAEGIAEFALGDEALKGLSLADKVGLANRLAGFVAQHPAVAEMASQGIRQGTVGAVQSAAHGATPEQAALSGGVTAAMAPATVALKTLAPRWLESAVGIGRRLRGATPGETALSMTSGFTPQAVERSAGAQIDALTNQLENAVSKSKQTVSLKPARDIIREAYDKALSENNTPMLSKLEALSDQLHVEARGGKVIPSDVSASRALDLKRGLNQAISTWSPETQKAIERLKWKVYGALDSEIDKAAPGTAQINQKIQSLIPIRNRAANTAADMFGRLPSRAGALIPSAVGGALGFEEGRKLYGPSGGYIGAALGAAAAQNPTAMISLSRLAPKVAPALPYAVRGLVPLSINNLLSRGGQ
jgi:hypothetical protein